MLAFQPSDLATQTASLQVVHQPARRLDLVRLRACWRSAPASRCCRNATYSFALAKIARGRHHRRDDNSGAPPGRAAVVGASLLAQHEPATRRDAEAAQRARAAMRDEMVCICGGCEHEPLSKMSVRPGRADARRAARPDRPGQDPRRDHLEFRLRSTAVSTSSGVPIDQGFNRLAWLLPYLVGATGSGRGGHGGTALVAAGPVRRPGTVGAEGPRSRRATRR